eukprot:380242-Amphidinium_carterae.1
MSAILHTAICWDTIGGCGGPKRVRRCCVQRRAHEVSCVELKQQRSYICIGMHATTACINNPGCCEAIKDEDWMEGYTTFIPLGNPSKGAPYG